MISPELLLANRWFARQSPALQSALAHFGRIVGLSPGQWVYGEGDEATGVVLVLGGLLRLEAAVAGRTVLVGVVNAGGSFGQSHRSGGGPRLVTARAGPPSRVMTVSDSALERIAADIPTVWQAVNALVYAQLDASVHNLAQTLALSPRARIAARLLLFADEGSVPLTQADIGELCGLSRKATNAHVAALETAGAIARGYGHIRIINAAILKSLVAAA